MDPEHKELLVDIDNRLREITTSLDVLSKTAEIQQDRDSVTVGAPSNGQIKCYGNADNHADFDKKIANMKLLLEAAKAENVKK